jgi:pilus assembly protein Flp/PilA
VVALQLLKSHSRTLLFLILFSGVFMFKLIDASKRFLQDERGVTSIEYGLIAAVTSVVIITALGTVGTNLETLWNTIAGALA